MRTPFVPVLVSGVLPMLAGAFFGWRGRMLRRADAGFVGRSVVSTAEVTDLRLLDNNPWDGERQSAWYPVVRFALPDGQVVTLGRLFTVLGIAGVLVGLVATCVWALLVLVLEVPT